MRKLIACFIYMWPIIISAQFNLRINILSFPGLPASENIYIAGNFNDWNPGDENFKLKKASGKFYFEAAGFKPGTYEFKFTLGNWETVELNQDGTEIKNRSIKLESDTVIGFSIARWKDGPSPGEKTHSGSPHVKIIDSSFLIPQLNRTRRIWLYLPKDYAASKKKYPVLYMHDGQNLFDDYTSYNGEWGVDETMDTIPSPCIVVGIDNGGGKRLNEYNVHDHPRYGKGEGRQYLEFLVKTLKPYIDKNYRTLRAGRSTMTAGSSMGGLISFYAGMYYPKVFGRIGVFSPSFEIAPQVGNDIKKFVKKKTHARQRYFFYAGTGEGKTTVTDMLYVFELMRKQAAPKMEAVIRSGAQHNETAWRKEFPAFYDWIIK